MTTVTERKSGSFCHYECRKSLSVSSSVGLEPLSRLKARSYGSPRRLSARFGLRLSPSQTQQKSGSQPADCSRRQFASIPPTRKSFTFRFGQRPQGPQEPESCRYHLDPDLNAPFSFSAVELPTGQSQIAFHKSNAVFDTKALFINRLSLARRGQFGLYRGWHEDQPQWALVTWLPIGPVFDHAIERELLSGPLSHSHVVPTADLYPSAIFKAPCIFGVWVGQGSRIIELNLSPAHRRTSETRIRRRRQKEDTVVSHSPENRDAQLVNRIEKWFARVMRIYNQYSLWRPTLPLDELLNLRGPVSNRIGLRRNPADFQWQCPTSLADAFGEQRQAVPQTHSRSAMHVAQLDGLGLGSWVISRIQNPDAPFTRRRIDRGGGLRIAPSRTLISELPQPVRIGDRLSQLLAGAIYSSVKAAPPISPQGTERHFDGRGRAWPDCQDINQIDQDPARWPKALRDVVTKIFYTRLRGAVCFFCHAPSVTLDARLVGEAWPPRFLTKLVYHRVSNNYIPIHIAIRMNCCPGL